MSIASEIAKMVQQPERGSTHRATVLRTDNDGTTWVQIPGGADETILTGELVECSPGDEVEVTIKDGRATATGNATAPAVGERTVERIVAPVRERLGQAANDADAAKLAAIAAQEAAEAASAANQHFWDDTNGAHVTEVEKDAWTDPTRPDYQSGHNMLVNSLGLLFRKALNNLASITQSAVAFFDGLGNDASNVVASFGANGFQAGKADESHLVGDYHSMKMVDSDGATYMYISDLRETDGYGRVTQVFDGGDTITFNGYQYYKLAMRPVYMKDEQGQDFAPDRSKISVTVNGATASAMSTISMGYPELQEWYFTTAGVAISPTASAGDVVEISYMVEHETAKAYTLGMRDAEAPVGAMSVADGYLTAATAYHAHAEGVQATASGMASHAQGVLSVASGRGAHAQGCDTVAKGDYQTALGKYNIADDSSAVIVGNGTNDNARSNAYTLDWSGNANYAGDVTAHSGSTAHNLTAKADQADLADLAAEVADIGDNVSKDISTNVQSSTSTWTSVGSIDLTEGIWVVVAGLQFSSNGTGYRYISLNNADGTPAAAWTRATRNSVPAISGNATVLHTSHIVTAGASGTTIHLMGWHNSGSQLNLTGRLNAVRIK